MKNHRPELHLPPTSTERLLDVLAVGVLVGLILLPAYWYQALPDSIPHHFGADGSPDRWGHKRGIWLMPGIGLALYVLFTWLNRRPHRFNYLVTITPDNAEYQYRNATTMLRVLLLFMLTLFVYITYTSIRIALGQANGESQRFTFLLVVVLEAAALFFVARSASRRART